MYSLITILYRLFTLKERGPSSTVWEKQGREGRKDKEGCSYAIIVVIALFKTIK